MLCGFLLLVGCSQKPDQAAQPTTTGSSPSPASTKQDKVVSKDVSVGKGREAASGDTVWVLYTGTLKNGKVFDSNMDGVKDVFTFTLGQGAVIKGWDQGVVGMRIGGERKLEIPASLGYGANGQGDKIPANSDLLFDVKLLGVQKVGEDNVIDCEDLKPGSGRVAKPGDTVTIQYVGALLNGNIFEDSKHFKKPFSFTLGKNQALPCIDEGVSGMKVGGKRRVIAPPSTAYTSQQVKKVPPMSEVVFTIDLVSIK